MKPIHVAGTKGKGSTSAFISSVLMQYVDGSSASLASSSSSVLSSRETSSAQENGVKATPTFKLRKIGLYTSPHLRSVRERIQINNEPLSESAFAKYFFEIWDRLEDAARARGEDPSATGVKPMYFRYLTLMALHAYMAEGVDSAVIECGIGGEYDATNILAQPTVTAVTTLGIDHEQILGSTLRDIAWHKSGIFKPGSHALTIPQQPEALEVLRMRASERGVKLHVVKRNPEIDSLKLGLAADFQKTNASLAVAAVAAHLGKLGYPEADKFQQMAGDDAAVALPLPAEFRRGLECVRLAGRCDIRRESDWLTWYIDGGHTIDSVRIAAQWYASCSKSKSTQKFHPKSSNGNINGTSTSTSTPAESVLPSPPPRRILLFNQQSRDALALARTLFATLADCINHNNTTITDAAMNSTTPITPNLSSSAAQDNQITHAFFCTNVTYRQNGYAPDLVSINTDADAVQALSVQHALAKLWKELDPNCDVRVFRTVEEAVEGVRGVALDKGMRKEDAGQQKTDAFVTGSLHLVGGLLEILEGGRGDK